jgi:hypothetical protein
MKDAGNTQSLKAEVSRGQDVHPMASFSGATVMKIQRQCAVRCGCLKKAPILVLGLAVLLTLFCFSPLYAQSVFYVRAGAAGSNSGADWDNAFADLPSSFQRGATYYVAAGLYQGVKTFSTPEAGAAYIYIKKATESDHGTNTGWSSSYGSGPAVFRAASDSVDGIWTFRTGYWDMDGAVGSFKSGHGFELSITDKGGGIAITDDFKSGNLLLKHIKIHKPDKDAPEYAGGLGFDFTCTSGTISNVLISHVYILNLALPFYFRNGNEIIVDHTVAQGNRSTPESHSEIASIRDTNNVVFRYCWFEDMEGTGGLMAMSGNQSNWEIYGNVFYWTGDPTVDGFGHGAIADNMNGSTSNFKIYNNTFVNLKDKGGLAFWAPTSNIVARNNLFVDSDVSNLGVTAWSHNSYMGDSKCINAMFQGTINRSCGCDSCPADESPERALGVNPFSGSTFRLKQSTAGGVALGDPYNRDPDGFARGADGVWDKGAFEFRSDPAPPKNLRYVPK